jgi:hypothetical protein
MKKQSKSFVPSPLKRKKAVTRAGRQSVLEAGIVVGPTLSRLSCYSTATATTSAKTGLAARPFETPRSLRLRRVCLNWGREANVRVP